MDRTFTIIRSPSTEDGTFGMMLDGVTSFCLTLEREWKNNETGESCIPDGDYICKRVNSPKFGNTFEITQVPERTHILFHKGNIEDDSHGCIILGEQFEPLNGKNAVLSSGKAFTEFLQRTDGIDQFKLSIFWAS